MPLLPWQWQLRDSAYLNTRTQDGARLRVRGGRWSGDEALRSIRVLRSLLAAIGASDRQEIEPL